MAFHFSRWGLLVPVVFLASCAGVVIAIDLTIGLDAAKGYRWPNCLIFFLSGTICWLLHKKFTSRARGNAPRTNDGRNPRRLQPNTFFFLSFQAWALIFYAFMLYHLLKPLSWGR